MTSNKIQKSATAAAPLVGTIADKGGQVADLIRPENARTRTALFSETSKSLRDAVKTWETSTANVVTLMVKILLFGTSTDAGDALDVLLKSSPELAPAKSQVAKARAAAYAVEAFGITSTASDEFRVILAAARGGIGRQRFEAALKGKRPATKAKVLQSITSVKGEARQAALKSAFGGGRQSDGKPEGTAAYRAAARGIETVEKAVAVTEDGKAMTPEERKAIAGLLRKIADGLR